MYLHLKVYLYLNISGNIYFKAESIHDLKCCFIVNLLLKYSSYCCSISIANQDDYVEKPFVNVKIQIFYIYNIKETNF